MSPTTPTGPETDPGVLRGMGEGTPLAQLRIMGVAMSAAVLMILGMGAVVFAEPLLGPTDMFGVVMLVVSAAGVGVAALLPVPALPADTPAEEAARRSGALFHQRTMVRLAICEVPALFGFVIAAVDPEAGFSPLLAGALISGLALALVALPTRAVIERFRAGLEAHGARSHLWEALRTPTSGGA